MTATVTALALAGALATFPAFAQQYPTGRSANDGGISAQPSGAPEYNGSGQVVPAPGNELGSSNDCATRFRSYDPATGSYLGTDGRRHPCS
ncbi:MAG: BA14K family protein [Xanthobacteraceae bacterium]